VKGPNPFHHRTHQAEVHMQMYIEGMCATERSRRMISQMILWTLIETAVALGQLLRRRRCVRLAEWVPPVGGAPSRRTSTSAGSWGIQARRKAR
jgi:hypothetical protein